MEKFPEGFENKIHDRLQVYQQSSLLKAFLNIPKRILFSNQEAPTVYIDIKFKHFQKLHAKREEALESGLLVQGKDDFVPGKIHLGNQTINVKLRLKGDWTDHLSGNKWSFRIHTKGKEHLFGLRRFSIQHPKTRGFQGELLFQEMLKHYGILTPKYFFVNTVINGNSIGIMAIEEHFSKELLERNGRKDGVIIRLDETFFWDATKRNRNKRYVFDSYLNAPIDSFQTSKIIKSTRLSREFAIATGLLKGFIGGKLTASEVFDVEQLGKYLAIAELWGALHEIGWINLRFFLNPLTLKLEPVAYDANVMERRPIGESVVLKQPITTHMLEDKEILAAFEAALTKLSKDIESGRLINHLKQIEEPILDLLQQEFVLLEGFVFEELRTRIREIINPSVNSDDYPILVHAGIISEVSENILEITSAVPHEVEVSLINWVDNKGNKFPIELLSTEKFPIRLPQRDSKTLPNPLRISFKPLTTQNNIEARNEYKIEVHANIKGHEKIVSNTANRTFPVLQKNPMPQSSIQEQLRLHGFLELSNEDNTILIKQGQWKVTGDIVIPRGYKVHIGGGTTLRFEKDGSFVIYGETLFQGSEEAPIVLESVSGKAGTWEGIAVYFAPQQSDWSNVYVKNTSGMNWPQWKLTGGVTFYKSDVHMESCSLTGTMAEDALNIVHSNFLLKDVTIENTASDGFDGDFTTGEIRGGTFRNIGSAGGGDGVDVSGSVISVEGTKFIRVSDKAISVGEGSAVEARNIEVVDSGVGAASKDKSELTLRDSKITNAINVALMTYTKKPEYGPAKLIAENVKIVGSTDPTRAQNGSVMILNGRAISTENIDVEEMYETTMKPGMIRK